MSVFFHKLVEGSNTIICKDAPANLVEVTVETSKGPVTHFIRKGTVQYGIYCPVDSDGKSIDARSWGLKKDQELQGLTMGSFCLDQEAMKTQPKDAEPIYTTLRWVVAS